MSSPTTPPSGTISDATLKLLNAAYADLTTVYNDTVAAASVEANLQQIEAQLATANAQLSADQAQAVADAKAAIEAVQADLGITPPPPLSPSDEAKIDRLVKGRDYGDQYGPMTREQLDVQRGYEASPKFPGHPMPGRGFGGGRMPIFPGAGFGGIGMTNPVVQQAIAIYGLQMVMSYLAQPGGLMLLQQMLAGGMPPVL